MSLHGEIMLQFAKSLVEGNFEEARKHLNSELRRTLSAQQLQRKLAEMIEYGDGPANKVMLVSENSMIGSSGVFYFSEIKA